MTNDEAIKYFERHLDLYCVDGISREAEEMAIQALSQEPTSEMVHVETLRQVMWERDIAIGQLKELGYSFGQKIEPCDDAISREAAIEAVKQAIYNHDSAIMRLTELPSVTQKSGKWIIDGSVDCYLDKVRCHCSECGKKKEFPADYDHIKQELSISYKHPEFIDNFCSKCGTRMESEVNNG